MVNRGTFLSTIMFYGLMLLMMTLYPSGLSGSRTYEISKLGI